MRRGRLQRRRGQYKEQQQRAHAGDCPGFGHGFGQAVMVEVE